MPDLHVEIDARSGFCFGVIYAVDMAEEILREEGLLYCLGDIVHNDAEVQRLEAMGLRIIDHDQLRNLHDVKVLIRAHGEPPETYQVALDNRLALIDASCPVILKLQNRIRQSHQQQERVLIYGKADHAEVIGLKGQTNGEALVFQDPGEVDPAQLPGQVTLYSQTTKSKQSFYSMVAELEKKGLQVKAHDTICRQVSDRDVDLRAFAAQYDRIVFVAGRKSSNGRMLYGVCREVNPNTYFVSQVAEVRKDWFRPGERIGICGATSTPQWLMEAVAERLHGFQYAPVSARNTLWHWAVNNSISRTFARIGSLFV